MFTVLIALLISVVPPVSSYWDSGVYWGSGWGSGFPDSGFWGSGFGWGLPPTPEPTNPPTPYRRVVWTSPPKCSTEKCWCDDLHGVKGYHRNIASKHHSRSDGCTANLWGSHDDHCCDEHDFCYTEAGMTRWDCDSQFCRCVTGVNKFVCALWTFGWEFYINAQKGWTECVYYPPRDKWHLIPIGSGRRRIEEPEKELTYPEVVIEEALNSDGTGAGSGAADLEPEVVYEPEYVDVREDDVSEPVDRAEPQDRAAKVVELQDSANKLVDRLLGGDKDALNELSEVGLSADKLPRRTVEAPVDLDDAPVVIHAHYIDYDPNELTEDEILHGVTHHRGNEHHHGNAYHHYGKRHHHAKNHGGSLTEVPLKGEVVASNTEAPIGGEVAAPMEGEVEAFKKGELAPKEGEVVAPMKGELALKEAEAVASEEGEVAPKEVEAVAPHEGELVAPKDGEVVAPKDGELVAPKEGEMVAPIEGDSDEH